MAEGTRLALSRNGPPPDPRGGGLSGGFFSYRCSNSSAFSSFGASSGFLSLDSR